MWTHSSLDIVYSISQCTARGSDNFTGCLPRRFVHRLYMINRLTLCPSVAYNISNNRAAPKHRTQNGGCYYGMDDCSGFQL